MENTLALSKNGKEQGGMTTVVEATCTSGAPEVGTDNGTKVDTGGSTGLYTNEKLDTN